MCLWPSTAMETVMQDRTGPAQRRNSVAVKVGDVTVGGTAPIIVQSMTNTDTADVAATAAQIAALARAGFALDYLEARNADTLRPIGSAQDGPVRLLVAARLGRTRLIDNVAVENRMGGSQPTCNARS